ncbi:MAG: hypothetical protein GC191_12680 [Azospirillum sp.]|nr:hypothetical protein [Azospirillum sp.]
MIGAGGVTAAGSGARVAVGLATAGSGGRGADAAGPDAGAIVAKAWGAGPEPPAAASPSALATRAGSTPIQVRNPVTTDSRSFWAPGGTR